MENLCIRIDVDSNLRYFAQQGMVEDNGHFDIFTRSPKFRSARRLEHWIRDNCQSIDTSEWSLYIELSSSVTRKQDHVAMERFARGTNEIHEGRRPY